MSGVDVAALRAAAEAAPEQTETDAGVTGVWLNSRHHFTLPPAVVLALLDGLEAAEAKVARVEAHREWLADERDDIRDAFRRHNAGRREGRPTRRPDLDTWANAYEVAERHLRAVLGSSDDQPSAHDPK